MPLILKKHMFGAAEPDPLCPKTQARCRHPVPESAFALTPRTPGAHRPSPSGSQTPPLPLVEGSCTAPANTCPSPPTTVMMSPDAEDAPVAGGQGARLCVPGSRSLRPDNAGRAKTTCATTAAWLVIPPRTVITPAAACMPANILGAGFDQSEQSGFARLPLRRSRPRLRRKNQRDPRRRPARRAGRTRSDRAACWGRSSGVNGHRAPGRLDPRQSGIAAEWRRNWPDQPSPQPSHAPRVSSR